MGVGYDRPLLAKVESRGVPTVANPPLGPRAHGSHPVAGLPAQLFYHHRSLMRGPRRGCRLARAVRHVFRPAALTCRLCRVTPRTCTPGPSPWPLEQSPRFPGALAHGSLITVRKSWIKTQVGSVKATERLIKSFQKSNLEINFPVTQGMCSDELSLIILYVLRDSIRHHITTCF